MRRKRSLKRFCLDSTADYMALATLMKVGLFGELFEFTALLGWQIFAFWRYLDYAS